MQHPAWAQKPVNVTPGEIALLPEYCAATQSFPLAGGGFQGSPSPAQRPWVERIGDTFWALHHYCWALVNVRRASLAGISASMRRHLHENAIADAQYVLAHATDEFALLPEILWRMGQWHMALGSPADALEHWNRAKTLRPSYWPVYLSIAEVNVSLGRRGVAQDALREGLSHSPGEPNLRKALDALVGRPPPSPAGRKTSSPSP